MISTALIISYTPIINQISNYGKLNQINNNIFYMSTRLSYTSYYIIGNALNTQLLYEALHTDVPSGSFTTSLVQIDHYVSPTYTTVHTPSLSILIIMCLLQLHLIARLYECMFIHKYNQYSQQHVFVTIGGCLFYLMLSITMYCDMVLFTSNIQSFYVQMNALLNNTIIPWLLAASLSMYGIAYIEQRRCHLILARLRGNQSIHTLSSPQQNNIQSIHKASKLLGADTDTINQLQQQSIHTKYSIPYGNWFDFISMPHYTAEILIYLSFFMIQLSTRDQFPLLQLLILLWTVVNLCITGYRSHLWYKNKFISYPTDRYAVIPYIL